MPRNRIRAPKAEICLIVLRINRSCFPKTRRPDGHAVFHSQSEANLLGEFTGFGKDSFLLPRQFGSPLARWKVGEGELHYQEPSVAEEWHNGPRNSAWKNTSTDTKVTERHGL